MALKKKIETEASNAIPQDQASASQATATNTRRLPTVDVPLARQLGQVCRAGRTALALTQEQVADQVGVHSEYYARIERGLAMPSVTLLAKLARALPVKVDDMFGIEQGIHFKVPNRAVADPPHLQRLARLLHRAQPSTVLIASSMVKLLELHKPPEGWLADEEDED